MPLGGRSGFEFVSSGTPDFSPACYRAGVSTPNDDRRIYVSAAVIRDEEGRLLLVRKRGTTAFMQPGGKPEPGETPAETLIRELEEELGLVVGEHQLTSLGRFENAAANEPGFTVVADVFGVDMGEQAPNVGAEIEEFRWVTHSDALKMDVAPLAMTNFITD